MRFLESAIDTAMHDMHGTNNGAQQPIIRESQLQGLQQPLLLNIPICCGGNDLKVSFPGSEAHAMFAMGVRSAKVQLRKWCLGWVRAHKAGSLCSSILVGCWLGA